MASLDLEFPVDEALSRQMETHLCCRLHPSLIPAQEDAVQFVDSDSSESVVFVFSGNTAGRRHVIPRILDRRSRLYRRESRFRRPAALRQV